MSNSQLQSLKSKNAVIITALHTRIKNRRRVAKELFEAAFVELKEARKATATIKKLARQQVTIKRDLKGPPKAKRPAKADSRIAANVENFLGVNPKVGGDFTGLATAVTGGAVSVSA